MHTQLSINPEKNVSIDLRVTNRNQKNKKKKRLSQHFIFGYGCGSQASYPSQREWIHKMW